MTTCRIWLASASMGGSPPSSWSFRPAFLEMEVRSRWTISSTRTRRSTGSIRNRPAAGVGQHLAAQVRGAPGGLDDLVQVLLPRRQRGDGPPGQVGVAQHGHQQVVEVVGDPAGQDAQALQPLGLLDLFLEPAPLGDVGAQRGHADDPALAVEPDGVVPFAQDAPPVPGQVLVHAVAGQLPPQQPLHDFAHLDLGVGRDEELEDVPSQDLLPGPAEDPLGVPVPIDDPAAGVPEHKGDGGGLVHAAVPLLALPEGGVGPPALRDVQGGEGHPGRQVARHDRRRAEHGCR